MGAQLGLQFSSSYKVPPQSVFIYVFIVNFEHISHLVLMLLLLTLNM